jgi:hypothetical protein
VSSDAPFVVVVEGRETYRGGGEDGLWTDATEVGRGAVGLGTELQKEQAESKGISQL